MKTQKAIRDRALLKKCTLGAHPILQWFIEKLNIPEIIGSYIPQDCRVQLGVEKTLPLLIHNILTSPMALYELADWLEPLDEGSVGLEPPERLLIQDDRVGKALEAFYRGRHKDVFFRLALKAIKIFELNCSQIHQDTTTVTFSGKYAGWTALEFLTYGKNKDHRPDLKQLVLGLSVTADGAVPLTHRIYDGNQSDDTLHPENHRRLRRLLERADFIYVADCKLATQDNKAQQDRETRERHLERAWQQLHKLQGKLNSYHLLAQGRGSQARGLDRWGVSSAHQYREALLP